MDREQVIPSVRRSRGLRLPFCCLSLRKLAVGLCLIGSACAGEQSVASAPPPLPPVAQMPAAPAAPPVAAPPAVTMVPVTPAPQMGPVAPPTAGTAAPLVGGAGGAGGAAAPAGPHQHDDCTEPTPPALEDAMLPSGPESWMSPRGTVDLILPKAVQSWMDARLFKEGHDGWHGVRRCDLIRAGGPGLPFSSAFELCDKKELLPAEQECDGAQDGYEFLVTHRHMINVLRQAFPTHKELFAGFPSFPLDAQDVPEAWRARFGNGWSPQILEQARVLDDIENQLAMFPSEGALGQFIQCGGMSMGVSVHGALHSKWIVNRSPNMLGDSATNLGNYMFWKLHGWIDDVWSRYRKAKGLRDDDPAHVAALVDQCREMHMLGKLLGPATTPGTTMPLPQESGVFHEQVRPILEDNCAGCHSAGSPEGGLVLGGNVTSTVIVANLLNVQASRGGQFKRVVAGNPMQSWLYLKASGKAASAGCMGTCNPQVMPPTGMVTLTAAELSTIESWIMQGAAAPKMP